MNAMVILQKCGQSGKTFGIRVQQMEDGEVRNLGVPH